MQGGGGRETHRETQKETQGHGNRPRGWLRENNNIVLELLPRVPPYIPQESPVWLDPQTR